MKINIKGSEPAGSTPESSSWERNLLEKLLLEVYREQRRNRIWRWFWRLLWLLIFILVIASSGSSKPTGAHTAVINLEGTISSDNNQADLLRKSLKEVYKNKNVKGIIIRANSPGGSPVISSIAYEEIRYFKAKHASIPLYVVTEDMCASGCYYIASAADKIYADPSSLVGSIGVIGSSFDFTGLIDKLGIKRRVKIAGSNKDMGDPFVPETPEQAQIWQQMLSSIHEQFIQAVQQGRGKRLKIAENPDIFSGRAYTGEEAKKVGLIDDFGNVYTVARDVIGAPDLVDYTAETSWEKRFSKSIGSTMLQNIRGMTDQPW